VHGYLGPVVHHVPVFTENLTHRSRRPMVFEKLLPGKFSSRLFLMTFAAGLIPVVIFTFLISTYGTRIESDVNRVIEAGYRNDMVRSEAMLREMGEASLYSRVLETAQQLDLVVESVPWMTLSDLHADPKFRELAVQSISQTGYTYLFEAESAIVRFHRDRRFENRDLRHLFHNLPEFQTILQSSLEGPRPSRGYYRVKAGDDNIMERYICIVPLHSLTSDGIRLMIAASVNAEDFSAGIRESQAIHDETRSFLTLASNASIRYFRHRGLLFMGIGILTISLLAFVMGIYSSRGVTRLREATARINGGDLSTPVRVSGSGEMATLTKDFNLMLDQLATTTVSRQLLQASEARLKVANAELRREIGERERTEEDLAAEKERLNVTLRSIGEGVISADREGKVVLINNVAEKLTGWKQEEALGVDLSRVFRAVTDISYYPPRDSEGPHNGGPHPQNPLNRKTLTSRNGTDTIIVETSSPICDKGGTALGTVIVFRDITDQRKVEEELLKARKLESLGILAGGIAHDFNNLLAVVLGNISFAKMFMKPEDRATGRLVEAENACLRGKDLTYQLLAFARGGEPLRKTTDVARLVEDTVRSSLRESGVTCLFSFTDGLFPVKIDAKQISQVIERMVGNAVEALENKGVLTVGVEDVTIGPGSSIALKQGGYVKISFRDEGRGIPPEDLQRIFDPYFTKKEMGYQKGTGLGLSVSYSVVKDHGGLITVESEEGKGTCFSIYLPADRGEEDVHVDDVAVVSGSLPRKGKLLFMDDDEGVRDVIVEMLIHLGYDVQFAKDGLQAIEEYTEAARSAEPFDVVVADLTVRDGMGGKELVRQLYEIDPAVRAVISSGYSTDPVLYDYKKHGFLGVVIKPYKIEELCAVLDSVMEHGKSAHEAAAEDA
jgi:PAS domain S-box-containing protein